MLLACATTPVDEPALRGFDDRLAELSVDTALVFPSQAIDEHPLWSPDGTHLGVNVAGRWLQVDLVRVKLDRGAWRRGVVVGVAIDAAAVSELPADEATRWLERNPAGEAQVTLGETSVELRQRGLATELVVTPGSGEPQVRWSSDIESCHSLVAAPDGKHVAFICELNGVLVLAFRQE
jgi:hypothetical protein